MLTAERLREVLTYDADTGEFRWRVRPSNRVRVGDVAGHLEPFRGYVLLRIDGRMYLGHRLAWLYAHGSWPTLQIDHRDGDRANNRIANLREATQVQNSANMKRRPNNTSGFKGVTWDKSRRMWMAQIRAYGVHRVLGHFDAPQDAHAAYVAAAERYFGEFARAA